MLRLLSFSLMLLIACNETPSKTGHKEPLTGTVAAEAQASWTRCYALTTGGNHVVMKLQVTGSLATGQLQYQIAEKDRNNGSFTGLLSGDTLTADYTFDAEGTRSVRQLKFLLTDSLAMEGYGRVEDQSGRAAFVPGTDIEYGKGIVLHRSGCEN